MKYSRVLHMLWEIRLLFRIRNFKEKNAAARAHYLISHAILIHYHISIIYLSYKNKTNFMKMNDLPSKRNTNTK